MKKWTWLILLLAALPLRLEAKTPVSGCDGLSLGEAAPTSVAGALTTRSDWKQGTGELKAWNGMALPEANDAFEVIETRWDALRQIIVVRMGTPGSLSPPFLVWANCDSACARNLGCIASSGKWDAHTQQLKRQSASAQGKLVSRGQTTNLVIIQSGLRMVLPAVALDEGGQGDDVRVRTRHGNRLFRAQVTGPGLVTAEIPSKQERIP